MILIPPCFGMCVSPVIPSHKPPSPLPVTPDDKDPSYQEQDKTQQQQILPKRPMVDQPTNPSLSSVANKPLPSMSKQKKETKERRKIAIGVSQKKPQRGLTAKYEKRSNMKKKAKTYERPHGREGHSVAERVVPLCRRRRLTGKECATIAAAVGAEFLS